MLFRAFCRVVYSQMLFKQPIFKWPLSSTLYKVANVHTGRTWSFQPRQKFGALIFRTSWLQGDIRKSPNDFVPEHGIISDFVQSRAKYRTWSSLQVKTEFREA